MLGLAASVVVLPVWSTAEATPGQAAAVAPTPASGAVPAPASPGASPSPTLRSHRELGGPWTFRRVARADQKPEAWLPATVPGCVHTDLFAAGKIGDPFYRLNEKDQQWIDRESWEYRTELTVDDATAAREHVELVFDGLDTYAEIFINGVSAAWTTNMFRTWRVDLKKHLKPGANTLVVRFRSPIEQVKPAYDRLGYKLPAANDQADEMVSMWTRKAPYHYGWDWGPRFVTSGIWRPVAIEAWDAARLEDVQVFQDRLTPKAAELTVKARVRASLDGKVRVRVGYPGAADLGVVEADVHPGETVLAIPVHIDHPELWWPNGLGPQRLYSFDVHLDTADGQARDQRSVRIGLRTIEVVHKRDKEGKSFTIKVNGAPVFMKGANWIPADSFPSRMTTERYRWLLRSAAATNMNMLRVWGGGIYEDDRFYELCDELGLLVWQDFMFACSMYPGDDAFIENVRREAIENVRRLRNHPSLALWAGNNEMEAAWNGWGWQQKFHLDKAAQKQIWGDYVKVFHELLPAVVTAEDPGRFYTRSSPSANEDDVKANKQGWGDMHYWGVWHAEEPYEKYADHVSRFMSEYGFQSFPDLDTVSRYTVPGDRNIEGPVMLAHQRHPRGNPLIKKYLARDFRQPKDFASFLYVGQLLQARVIGFAAETHRRHMGTNWGSLYWQLDDCWPVASWSSIDYFGHWKALQYAARRFFAPELVSVVDDAGKIEVWGTSDRRANAATHLSVRLLDFDGRELWRREHDVTLKANSSHVLLAMPRRDALGKQDPAKVLLVAELTEKGQRLSRSVFTFAKTKDLDLPKPDLRLAIEPRADGSFGVRVTAQKFAPGVYFTGPDGFFDDNTFDMLPGESTVVGYRSRASMTADAVAKAIHAISVVDSY